MFNVSPEKLVLLGILALIVLGPNRLPQAARTLGRLLAELRRMSGSLQTEVRDALAEPRDALSHAVGDLGLDDLRNSVRDTLSGASSPASPAPPAPGPVQSPGMVSSATAGGLSAASLPPVPDDPSLN
ncbi:MAG: twin-arginine translocase TatA/TatE family subunit [Actinomycetota bacterium]|nr:twin-arginine translocase TatA/TatE family subunit [Actinomycetota bacterium]